VTPGFIGRFAPSPTGLLHLGNARSALLGWLWARREGGRFLVRVEDLDPERSRAHFIAAALEDLAWLGLDWDGEVWRQSARGEAYRAALEKLKASGLAYPCSCTRAEVARAASAPHPGEDGPVYPGTCRQRPTRPDRAFAWRFRVPPGVTRFSDAVHGPTEQDVAAQVGDFVVQRADGVASYQLAVVVDDAAQGVTHVLRADDLLGSTPRQLLLLQALGLPAPAYAHVPLLLGPDGQRLAKREGHWTLAGLRAGGATPEAVVGFLAHSCGLGDSGPLTARALVEDFSLGRLSRQATPTSAEALAALASRKNE
jgi:glutamyl-tRNA synthetase